MASDFVVIDAGPIVALLNERDQHHRWAIEMSKILPSPYFTTEAALSESFFLLAEAPKGFRSLLSLLERASIQVLNICPDDIEDVVKLMRRYADQPMSLADATLVRFSEIHDNVRIYTTDKHFRIYRRNGRQMIPLIAPWSHPDN